MVIPEPIWTFKVANDILWTRATRICHRKSIKSIESIENPSKIDRKFIEFFFSHQKRPEGVNSQKIYFLRFCRSRWDKTFVFYKNLRFAGAFSEILSNKVSVNEKLSNSKTSGLKLIKIGENVQTVYMYICAKGFLKIVYRKAARGRYVFYLLLLPNPSIFHPHLFLRRHSNRLLHTNLMVLANR